jgi:hypothetical protein
LVLQQTLPYSKEPTRIAGEDCAEADRFAANLVPIIREAQKAGAADVLNARGGSRRRMKLPGAMLRGSGPRCAGVAFASVGEFARRLRRRLTTYRETIRSLPPFPDFPSTM